MFDKLPRRVTYLNKNFHSFNDEPAVLSLDNDIEFDFFFKNGQLHRDQEAAIDIYERNNYERVIMYIYEGRLHNQEADHRGLLMYACEHTVNGKVFGNYYLDGHEVDYNGVFIFTSPPDFSLYMDENITKTLMWGHRKL